MSDLQRRRCRAATSRDSTRFPSLELLEQRALLTLAGNQLFPSNNPWNQSIAAAPVAANSSAIINNIISLSGSNGRLHPDFGQDTGGATSLFGIPYNIVHGNSTTKVNVVIDDFSSQSDIQPIPLPANAVIEGDQQNGPTVGLANRGDSHLIVYDEDNNIAYELYQASRPSENSDGKWHADPGVGLEPEPGQLPAPGLDLGRRRGPADPPGLGPTRRGSAGQPGRAGGHQSCDPLHADQQRDPQPVHLPRIAHRQPGQQQRRHRAGDGDSVPPQGECGHLQTFPRVAGHRPGDEDLRPDPGR
jgi:hypothetical protein